MDAKRMTVNNKHRVVFFISHLKRLFVYPDPVRSSNNHIIPPITARIITILMIVPMIVVNKLTRQQPNAGCRSVSSFIHTSTAHCVSV